VNLFWYVLVLRQISICFNSLQPLIAGHEIVGHVVKIEKSQASKLAIALALGMP